MNKAFLGSVAALASLLVGATVGASAAEAAATEVSRIDFETRTIDASPPGFTAELTGKGKPVQWMVLEDAGAPAGPKVLAETSGDSTSNRFPLDVLNGFEARTSRYRSVSSRWPARSINARKAALDITNWSKSLVHEVLIVPVDSPDAPLP